MPDSSSTQFSLDSDLLEPGPDYPMAASEIADLVGKITVLPNESLVREVLIQGIEARLEGALASSRRFRDDDNPLMLASARDAALGAFLLLDRFHQDRHGLR